jgi:SAM-dependent methyltransferase
VKRAPQAELLDDDSISNAEVLASLRDLRTVNRLFGGVSTTAHLLRRAMLASGLREASVLEVAAGDGYAIRHAIDRLNKEGLEVDPLCLDRREIAAEAHCCPPAMSGDALHLPFSPASFDFVSCGLFLHHLPPLQVIAFINGALRVARRAVLINDLRRNRMHLALIYLWTPLLQSPISRADGIASVRQAYTREEIQRMLSQTKASSFEIGNRFLFRIGGIAWK